MMHYEHKMHRKHKILMACGALAGLLNGCFGATTAEQRYYTMSLPKVEQPTGSRHNAELLLREVDVSPVYNRPQIVYRISPQELQFFHQNSWADRPSRMIGQLLNQAFTNSGLFRSVVDRLGVKPPMYVLDTNVEAIEELQGGGMWFAHLSMTLRLARFEDNRAIWQYTFDERRPLDKPDVGLVVRAMSEILNEQFKIAIPQLEAVLAGRPLPAGAPVLPLPAAVSPTTTGAASPTIEPVAEPPKRPQVHAAKRLRDREPTQEEGEKYDGTNGMRVNWRRSAQFASDDTVVPVGKGAIFLPSLSLKADREPPVNVRLEGKVVASGTMGRRIGVRPGHYQVTFGSGPESQRMVREVEVIEGETTLIPPDWATLDVSVVTAKFIPFLGTYEIIRMDDHEYLGVGYGVDEELGQQTQVWVLRPGLHKIVQAGSTYRARTNFSTVRMMSGSAVPFTLVQDELTRDFLGAGVAEHEPDRNPDEHWTFRSALGGSVLLTNRSEGYSSAAAGSSLGIDVFADNRARFASEPHLWTTRLEIEEGQTLQPTIGVDNKPGRLLDGRLQSVKDRVYLNSIYIYQWRPWVGPYLRIGGETTLFSQFSYFDKPTTIVIQDADGNNPQTRTGIDGKGETRFELAGSLAPIQLKQGTGVNFRVLHNLLMDMDVRTGLGSRQYIARGQLVPSDDVATQSFELRQVRGTVLTGLEISALSLARLSRYIQASTEFDMLVPFEGIGQTQLTWRNSVSLRLGSFAAITYNLNVVRQPNVRPDSPYATEQGLQLRFYYSPL